MKTTQIDSIINFVILSRPPHRVRRIGAFPCNAQLGVQQGALNILGVSVGFIVVGYLLVALDRALGKRAVA